MITRLNAKTILSSTGSETVQASVTDEHGREVTASVPAGISAGKYEVKNVPASEAVAQIAKLGDNLLNVEMTQSELDQRLVEAQIGGNAMLAVSTAFWKAGLAPEGRTYNKFPKLMTLMFEGGKHGSPNISVQEFAIIEDSIEAAAADFGKLKSYLEGLKVATTVGVEGAFSPTDFDNFRVLDTLSTVFPGQKIALDVAGSFADGEVDYGQLINKYAISSIEDPYSDEDWDKWGEFYRIYGSRIMVVGDDLTVTNSERLKMALDPQVINAVIIKPNQNGTISGTWEAISVAREKGLALVVSHRAQETDDDWLADFALEAGADYVKFGGMDRGERIAKYNRLRDLGMR